MKLSHAILAVMLDGQEHSVSELVSRIGWSVKPEKAARMRTRRVVRCRELSRSRATTDRQCQRTPDPTPEGIDLAEAVQWMVARCLQELRRGKGYIENVDGNGTWRLRPEARGLFRTTKGLAGSVASAIRESLLARGELP